MSAPDPKAVEAALHDLDAAHRCVGSHTLAPDTMRTLEAAAHAYLRAPTAPQGAEPVAWRVESGPWSVLCATKAEATRLQQETGDDVHNGPCTVAPLCAAPQGAEIAREPTQAMASAASTYVDGNRDDWTFAGIWRAMYDAALTPTDAETKHGT